RLAVELEREQLGGALTAVDHLEHGLRVHDNRLGLGAAVEDGGYLARTAQALGDLLAGRLASLDRQLLHLHRQAPSGEVIRTASTRTLRRGCGGSPHRAAARRSRSEEHTSELQSRGHLVCRLLLEKKKKNR